jgi:NAD dependent epimerase/dehydratase
MNKSQKIMVSGADGFIGSHLAEELVRRGYNVRAFVLYNSFNSWGWLDQLDDEIKNELDVYAGDIRDPFGVKEAMRGCDIVMNLAALIAIPYSYKSPDTFIDTNVKGALNVVQAARDLNIDRVIQTSTSEVYGTARFTPITEEHPLQGQSPYSASKIGADHIAMSYYHAFETPVCIIRPFNTFGPRQSARAIIPTVITQIAQGKRKIKVGALDPTRDFNYIKDIVKGFIAAINSQKCLGEAINLGSGSEFSIQETIQIISEVMNTSLETIQDQERIRPKNSEVERLLACNKKAEKLLGWKPEYTGLEGFKKALKETSEWFVKPENLHTYKANIYNI